MTKKEAAILQNSRNDIFEKRKEKPEETGLGKNFQRWSTSQTAERNSEFQPSPMVWTCNKDWK